MKTARILSLALLLVASTVWAGGPTPQKLPATAQWVVHVDMEAVLATQMGKGLLDLVTAEGSPVPPEDVKKIQEVWTWLGKVQSVTIFGSGFTPDQPVLLARLTYDRAEIEKMAHITADNARTAYGKHEIITLPGREGQRGGFGCFYNADTIVAGASLDRVKEAIDVLDGRGKAMTSAQPLRAMLVPAEGSCVLAAATGFNKMLKAMAESKAKAAGQDATGKDAGAHAAVLTKCTSARFEAGEAKGTAGKNVFATLEMTMETAEDAENVSLALQGVRAFALMHLKEQETKEAAELIKLIRSLQAGHEGTIFGAAFEYPVAEALEKMQALMKMAAARRAAPMAP